MLHEPNVALVQFWYPAKPRADAPHVFSVLTVLKHMDLTHLSG